MDDSRPRRTDSQLRSDLDLDSIPKVFVDTYQMCTWPGKASLATKHGWV